MHAAEIVFEENRSAKQPVFFLVCQSIELSFKAFLRGKGYSEQQLRCVGHDLAKAAADCKANGLGQYYVLTPEDEVSIQLINPYYQTRDLQYLSTGFKRYPLPDALIKLAGTLCRSTRDICIAMRSYHDGKNTEVS